MFISGTIPELVLCAPCQGWVEIDVRSVGCCVGVSVVVLLLLCVCVCVCVWCGVMW